MDFDPNALAGDGPSTTLLEPGVYEMIVTEAEEKTSSKGNPMIALVLEPVDRPGARVRSWLVATPAALFKVKEFCDAAGLADRFNSGRLGEDDCRNVRVRAEISIEEGTGGFGDTNRIEHFLPPKQGIPTSGGGAAGGGGGHDPDAQAPAHQPISEEDIPF